MKSVPLKSAVLKTQNYSLYCSITALVTDSIHFHSFLRGQMPTKQTLNSLAIRCNSCYLSLLIHTYSLWNAWNQSKDKGKNQQKISIVSLENSYDFTLRKQTHLHGLYVHFWSLSNMRRFHGLFPQTIMNLSQLKGHTGLYFEREMD